jgi:hypothetical protein
MSNLPPPKRKPNFKKDLQIGAKGEEIFLNRFQVKLEKLDGTKNDFIVTNSSKDGLELKTDTYDSGNFFFERWSDVTNKKPGGPYQAIQHSKYLAYFFIKKDTYYLFDLEKLVPFLDTYIETKKPKAIEVRNRSHTTVGYALPIKDFQSLFLDPSDLQGEPNNTPKNKQLIVGK